MCGIVGFFDLLGRSDGVYRPRVLERAVAALRHRGPDDCGTWFDPTAEVGLGHRRLAVIDPSPGARQPMPSACGRYVVTSNGEIYNFQELRRRLEAEGHRFQTQSDTEVLLATLSHWSLVPGLQQITGMYAFAVWDRVERELTLVRDRLGEKPLYYALHDGVLLFASELKALACWPGWNPDIDRGAVCLLLRLGYIPGPWTIFRGVFKLPPGCRMTVKASHAVTLPEPVPYWSLAATIEAGAQHPYNGSGADAAEHLEELMLESVQQRLIADVPVGAWLSGGIDSSYVTALAAECSGQLRTFTVGSTNQHYDESKWARAVADHLGTKHTEIFPSADELARVATRLGEIYDEPFADSSQVPTFLLAQLARRKTTVCLAGDGADELFGGYVHYTQVVAVWRRLRRLPLPIRRSLARFLESARGSWPSSALYLCEPVRCYLGVKGHRRDALYRSAWALRTERPLELYRSQVTEWRWPEKVVQGAVEPDLEMTEAGPRTMAPDELLRHMLRLDGTVYLPDDILTKVDRASMAVALEVRLPFLDHRVVEFACSLPLHQRIRGNKTKWALRQALARRVPRRLTERPKQGFGIPLDDLLRHQLRGWAEELLDASRLRREGYFNPAPIRQRWSEHMQREAGCNWGGPLWSILMFQAWHEAYQASRTCRAGEPALDLKETGDSRR